MAIVYPRTTHREAHFTGSATVRDVVIGMSDGLTVPFALAAGLSGAVESSFIVLVAGVAEMAAGSMAMGLGGYLAARSEADSFGSELARERAEVRDALKSRPRRGAKFSVGTALMDRRSSQLCKQSAPAPKAGCAS